ncbi:MAG TPA: 50S ribosomal protein L3 N(5)-glutamine methyltransferase [Opitutaceae bacterium]|nr:50S ribosomal protein L3 N(5)-glutamine methyltransferase [Opitutaceae bacterium]
MPDPTSGRGCRTLGEWLAFAEREYARQGIALGQVATSAHDEALYLLLHTLGLPLDSAAAVLQQRLTPAEVAGVRRVLRRRLRGRVPAAYLTREAFLGGHRFYVDERAIIPRSYFLEIIPRLGRLRRGPVRRAADVGTGSGCLAILLAHRFPRARVDAIDHSAAALAVARINVARHGLARRVVLYRSDVFRTVPPAHYDLIVSNPPYEPSALMKTLPPEFRKEPRAALDGGRDGLDVIRQLVAQAGARLAARGHLLIEVGGLRAAINATFGHLHPRWLPTRDGTNCICLLEAHRLRAAAAAPPQVDRRSRRDSPGPRQLRADLQ